MDNRAPPFAASLGTVCRVTAPANKSEGSIEEALHAILDLDELLTLDELLVALPSGWSRTEALSALCDGVHGNWIASSNREGRTYYRLAGRPPQKRSDPLVLGVASLAAVPVALPPVSTANFRERIDFMRMNLRGLLADACSEDVPCVLLQHLAEAGTAIDNAYNRLI